MLERQPKVSMHTEFIERRLNVVGDMMADKDGNVIMDDCSYEY